MKKCSLIFLIAACCFINGPSAFGCVCDGIPTVAEELAGATAIFSGKFIAAEYRKGIVSELRSLGEHSTGEKVDYEVLVLKFQVARWWKGDPVSEVILITDQTRDPDGTEHFLDCDYPFEGGEHYLVYAYGAETKLGTSTCTRTRKLRKARKDLKILGKGRKPETSR